MIPFWAEIVDVENDDEKAGRAKIRILEDQSDLKDNELRYARPLFPVTAASKDGAGATPAYQVGTRVWGFFIDNDKQIPYIVATAPGSGKVGSLGQQGRDIPLGISKDPGKFNIKTEDLRYIIDAATGKRKLDTRGLTHFAKKEANGLAKFGDMRSIGTQIPFGKNVISQISKVDPMNASGVLGQGVMGLLKGLQSTPAGRLINMIGIKNFAMVLNQITSNNKSSNTNNLLEQYKAFLYLLNNIINYLNNLSPKTALNYKTNLSNIQEVVRLLENPLFFKQEVIIILTLNEQLTDYDGDTLVKQLELILVNLITLRQLTINEIGKQ
jgi:hypothetical protein